MQLPPHLLKWTSLAPDFHSFLQAQRLEKHVEPGTATVSLGPWIIAWGRATHQPEIPALEFYVSEKYLTIVWAITYFFGASPEPPTCIFNCSLDISTFVSERCLKSNIFLFKFTSHFWHYYHPRWPLHCTWSYSRLLPFPFAHIESEHLLGPDAFIACLSSPSSPCSCLLL